LEGLRDTRCPMAQDARSVARDFFVAITHHDTERLTELTTPDIEWRSFFAIGAAGGVYRGHEGIGHYLQNVADAWETVRAEVEDTLLFGDTLVAVGRLRFEGRQSGVETTTPAGWVFEFSGPQIDRFRAFQDPEEALRAIGLPGVER
ncbi:MAG: nuclear transport factor 2 family protein, partial [Actinomycetota bacterium]|nr:nuclear transport factor 2 family protein [Actinomycetota bacterium]